MNSIAAFVATLALAVPAPPAVFAPAPETVHEVRPALPPAKFGPARPDGDPFRALRDSYRPEVTHQVHIEEHVVIRLAPTSPTVRRGMMPLPPRADGPVRYKEKKHARCVPLDEIAAIAPTRPNRLLLFMRDHRLLSASLERACDADAFYLGAYVDQSEDGRLCSGRDTLRARTGAKCRIARISRLVAVKD
jgi:hypothetical protein